MQGLAACIDANLALSRQARLAIDNGDTVLVRQVADTTDQPCGYIQADLAGIGDAYKYPWPASTNFGELTWRYLLLRIAAAQNGEIRL